MNRFCPNNDNKDDKGKRGWRVRGGYEKEDGGEGRGGIKTWAVWYYEGGASVILDLIRMLMLVDNKPSQH